MKNFQRALVAMDLSKVDEKLLAFTRIMVDLLSLKKLYAVHIVPDFTAPDNLDAEFHKLFAPEYPIDEKIRDKIKLDLEAALGSRKDLDVVVNVVEGSPYEKLIHWIEVKEIDLLLVGHKEVSQGSGITAKRIARRSKCNIIFVPESFSGEWNRIVVPIDFSENSARALKKALQLRVVNPGLKIETVYVVDLPPDSYYIQSTENAGFKSLLVESAQETYEDFLKKQGVDKSEVTPVFLENDYVNIAAHLQEYVEESQPDLVIIGAKGHTALENFFYGSVTEKFVERCKKTPVMIVR